MSCPLSRRADEARAFAKTIEADVVRGDYLQPALAQSRFDRWAEEWLRTTSDLRTKTRVGYKRCCESTSLPHFAGWQVGRIEASHLRQYLADLRARGAGPGTVHAARKVLRLVLATAVEGGALRANPSSGIRVARSEPVEMAFLSMDQVLALASALRRPEYGLLFASPPYPGYGPVRSAPFGSAAWTWCRAESRSPRASPR